MRLFDWVREHLAEIGTLLVDHVVLTVLAVGIGLLISFPIAVYVQRHRRLYPPVTAVAGTLYAVPSLALFAMLVPLTGLTKVTAEIGLVSYTLLILIRNVVVGIDGVPADTKEAARAMGYTDRGLLWRVELPLALPAIVAGIRIATVTTIGLVTVTVFVTEGGLGQLILRGISRGKFDAIPVIVGAGLCVVLAVTADALLVLAQRLLTPWAGGRRLSA